MKPVLSGQPRDPRYCPHRGVRLVQVHLTENKGRKIGFTEAGVRLMQDVHLIQGPLNAGLTVDGCFRIWCPSLFYQPVGPRNEKYRVTVITLAIHDQG